MASNPIVKDFLQVFLVPTLANKALLIYFGINYSAYPGEGYGYGVIASVVFLLLGVFRFVWKYRGIEDP
jgi:hypothetical protein